MQQVQQANEMNYSRHPKNTASVDLLCQIDFGMPYDLHSFPLFPVRQRAILTTRMEIVLIK